MNLKYWGALQKLRNAVEIMATGSGNRPERLQKAFRDELIAIHPDNLPLEQREIFIQFRKEMTCIPDTTTSQTVGALQMTVWAMHWKKAERLSKTLFQLYQAVNEAYYSKEVA